MDNLSTMTIEELQKKLPNRTKSFLEHKMNKLHKDLRGEQDLDLRPKTLHEINERVFEAIEHAFDVIDDLEAIEALNTQIREWQKASQVFLLSSISLVALLFMNEEEIKNLLGRGNV